MRHKNNTPAFQNVKKCCKQLSKVSAENPIGATIFKILNNNNTPNTSPCIVLFYFQFSLQIFSFFTIIYQIKSDQFFHPTCQLPSEFVTLQIDDFLAICLLILLVMFAC